MLYVTIFKIEGDIKYLFKFFNLVASLLDFS